MKDDILNVLHESGIHLTEEEINKIPGEKIDSSDKVLLQPIRY